MNERDLLFEVIKRFTALDLSPVRVTNMQMGYIFEELIRIGAEQSNEEAGEHFTAREVIQLMVGLLLSPEPDLAKSHVVKTICGPACGNGASHDRSNHLPMAWAPSSIKRRRRRRPPGDDACCRFCSACGWRSVCFVRWSPAPSQCSIGQWGRVV